MTDSQSGSNLAGAAPYTDSVDHLRDELGRLDLLLRYHLEAWWASHDGTVDEFRGLYVSDETADSLFPADVAEWGRSSGDGHDTAGDAELLVAAAARADAIATRARLTVEAGTELRLPRLTDRFDLSRTDVDALLVALAPAFGQRYETLYSYLHDDVTAKRPTVGLVCTLLSSDGEDPTAVRRPFAHGRPLVRHRLLRLHDRDAASLLSRPVTVDERIVDYLLGSDDVDAALDGVVERFDPDETGVDHADLVRTLGLTDDSRDAIARLLSVSPNHNPDGDGATTDPRPPMAYVWGPRGSGRHTVATAVARSHDRSLLAVEAARVTGDAPEITAVLDRVRREAVLQDAVLSIRGLDSLPVDGRERLVTAVDDYVGPVVLSGEADWQPRSPPSNHVFVALPLSVPNAETRRRLWRSALGETDVGETDVDALASKFRLTPGGIRDAVETARQSIDAANPTVSALYDACRRQAGGSLSDLAESVPQPYGWDDIVLPDERMTQLREVAAHVAHRGTVYDDWGFADRYATGNGLVALFSGPSGTGKTMAASIVAREAGLDLYRIDLSSVVSKYIGETEKNLARVFDEAGKGDAVLLFDEADALFGKRSEVKDAHDRYANVEVNYLLQRVETYDGVVILTTNFKRNIDEAFTRRIHLSVEFPRPDEAARAAIWSGVFPEATPVHELDVEFLSRLELTGGSIKNAALTAAFVAAEAGEDVRMPHVVRAVRRELQKSGTLVAPETFADYEDDLT